MISLLESGFQWHVPASKQEECGHPDHRHRETHEYLPPPDVPSTNGFHELGRPIAEKQPGKRQLSTKDLRLGVSAFGVHLVRPTLCRPLLREFHPTVGLNSGDEVAIDARQIIGG